MRGQSQLHAHAARARAHVPADVARAHGQLAQCRGAHLLLCHRHLPACKRAVRNARRALRRAGRGLGQQHAQRCKRTLRALRRGGLRHTLVRIGKVLPHRHGQPAQARFAQLRAQRGRAERAAREEQHRSAAAHRRSRVARRAVGGDERPVLPGAAQTRGQKLHAGNTRQHPRRNAVFRQQRQQAARAGIKARVAAVRHNAQGGVSPRFQHGLQHLLRARCFHSARRAARGQRGQ